MAKTYASLSLDLDNQWSYMKTHGDAGWEAYPSYLSVVVPRVLEILARKQIRMTWFIVGKDADAEANYAPLRMITDAGHEVGNHSYHHEPWLHLYSQAEIESELAKTEAAIERATGQAPRGFRGPGFSLSPTVLQVLEQRGYNYDCSTFPTYLGPIARWYYFAKAKDLSQEEKAKRSQLFGKFSEGFRRLKPYTWQMESGNLLEIPVTTMPLFKVPIHASYVLYLAGYSRTVAKLYFRLALRMCQLFRVEPSILLHPLDFMGVEDKTGLEFFPAMRTSYQPKCELMEWMLDTLKQRFEVVPMGVHAEKVAQRKLPKIPPDRYYAKDSQARSGANSHGHGKLHAVSTEDH